MEASIYLKDSIYYVDGRNTIAVFNGLVHQSFQRKNADIQTTSVQVTKVISFYFEISKQVVYARHTFNDNKQRLRFKK